MLTTTFGEGKLIWIHWPLVYAAAHQAKAPTFVVYLYSNEALSALWFASYSEDALNWYPNPAPDSGINYVEVLGMHMYLSSSLTNGLFVLLVCAPWSLEDCVVADAD